MALIPVFISISWRYSVNEIHIFTDAGRLCRPLFYNDYGDLDVDLDLDADNDPTDTDTGAKAMTHKKISVPVPIPSYIRMMRHGIKNAKEVEKWTWADLVCGTAQKVIPSFNYETYEFYEMDALYGIHGEKEKDSGDQQQQGTTKGLISRLRRNQSIVEYLDQSETESAFIGMDLEVSASELKTQKQLRQKERDTGASSSSPSSVFTHFEIHPSLILGVMGNQIAFVENNQFPRDAFGCGQAKQTASVFHTNFSSRIDKMSMVINNGQIPLVKSRLLEYINNEQHPNGENAIVAIACYNGYNVEDSILFNEAAIKRGLFNITYYNMYEDCEEDDPEPGSEAKSFFSNSVSASVRGVNNEHDYRHLDASGIVKENTQLTEKVVVIGKLKRGEAGTGVGASEPDLFTVPTVAKKGQLGYVDRTYITEGMKGTRIAKVRVREHRLPAVGDKFCSRCGQKGTVGVIVPECDMPFTSDGIRPDIIVNPHAFPSRLTVGQLIETLVGKACLFTGTFGDCTAFSKTDPATRGKMFGDILADKGFHPSGNQVLYNGMTGEQIESDIFIGPTYYMRLKQMVKDKINYRRTGPNTALTRQPVQGRANDGGLRVGEMERDSIISHGTSRFLQESMMKRGDQYYLAICNTTGMIAVYNESQDLFISPMADGPIKYAGNMTELKSAQVVNVTRHGRSFSVVHIPYSLKLLIQELLLLNVQMRIITDANIDSIESMASSKNIELLMKEPGSDLSTVAMETARVLGVENLKPSMVAHLKTTLDASDGHDRSNDEDDDDADNSDEDEDEAYDVAIATNPNKRREGTKKARGANKKDSDFPETVGLAVPESIRLVEEHGWMLLPELGDRYGETFASIVTNESGKPTEFWHTTKHEGRYPNRYPQGWNPGPKNKWASTKQIETEDKVAALKLFPEPTRDNLKLAQEYLLQFKSDKYPRIPFLSTTRHSSSPETTEPGTQGEGDNDDSEIFEGNSVAVIHSQLINVGKQISAIEMKVQQIEQRSVNADSGEKEYQKEDLSELERLVRQLVKLQSDKERLTKQLADEQLVKTVTANIMSSPSGESATTPLVNFSGSYSPQSPYGYGMYSPPYTASSPVSPMVIPMQMPMQMQMPMPMQMQPMMVQAGPQPATTTATTSGATTSGSAPSDPTTKTIVLKQ